MVQGLCLDLGLAKLLDLILWSLLAYRFHRLLIESLEPLDKFSLEILNYRKETIGYNSLNVNRPTYQIWSSYNSYLKLVTVSLEFTFCPKPHHWVCIWSKLNNCSRECIWVKYLTWICNFLPTKFMILYILVKTCGLPQIEASQMSNLTVKPGQKVVFNCKVYLQSWFKMKWNIF